MASLRRWLVLAEEGRTPATEGIISELLKYRQYAGEITLMFIAAPKVVRSPLIDVKEAIAGAASALEEGGHPPNSWD